MGFPDISRLGLGGSGIPDTLPRAIAAALGLKALMVAGAAANTAIPIAIDPEDVIIGAVDLTTPAQLVLANITITDRRATGAITLLTTIADGDIVSVNGKAYTFKAIEVTRSTNIAPNVIPITITPSGIDVTVVGARFAQVLMSSDNALTAAAVAGVVTVTWRVAGTAGNAITLAVTASNAHATRSGATLTGGTATQSIKSSDSTAAKNLLIMWYNTPA